MIAYGHREPDAHLLTTSMSNMFVSSAGSDNWTFNGDGNEDLYKVGVLNKGKRKMFIVLLERIFRGI